jgi:hypothetical protein
MFNKIGKKHKVTVTVIAFQPLLRSFQHRDKKLKLSKEVLLFTSKIFRPAYQQSTPDFVFRADLINPAFLLHTFAVPQICYVIAVVIIIIIIVIVIVMKSEYIPGYSSLWRINFVNWCLVFMDRQYGTC